MKYDRILMKSNLKKNKVIASLFSRHPVMTSWVSDKWKERETFLILSAAF